MISIAVVTRRAGFTLTMHSPSHLFTEVRPSAGWVDRPLTEDVLVLDLETAEATAEAVTTLRGRGTGQPIIIVANDTDGWDGVFAEHPDLFLVSLPVTRTSLLSTVDRAARLAPVAPATSVAPVVAEGVGPTAPLTDAAPRTVDEPAATPGDETVSVPRPHLRRTSRSRAVSASEGPSLRPSPPGLGTDRAAPAPVGPVHLVRELRPLVGQLSRVPEVAELLRQRCVSAVPCEASAVLVPDGEAWRVAAGENLRPLENRLQVDSIHWLITEVVGQGHGVLIRDSDIARTRLSGAPLAAWPNLMAIPVPDVNAVVLLARQVRTFSRNDLTKGKQAIGPAALQLGEAIDVRDLARALSPFANPVE